MIEASVLERELINEGVFKSFSVEVVVDWQSLRLMALNFSWTTKQNLCPSAAHNACGIDLGPHAADLIADFLPVAGLSDDLAALAAFHGLWRHYVIPEFRSRA